MDSSKELWNHPLCWSLPSRYISSGQDNSGFFSGTAAWLTPESNHTSRMSISCSHSLFPHCVQDTSPGKSFSTPAENHMSAPCSSASPATWSTTFLSSNKYPHFLQVKAMIGTPHVLCLDMHQSGLTEIIP